jgi:hypothetical protein
VNTIQLREAKTIVGGFYSEVALKKRDDDLEEGATSAWGGKDVVGEVKGVDELGVRVACSGAWSRGERRGKIEVDPKRRSLRQRERKREERERERERERDVSRFFFDCWWWCVDLLEYPGTTESRE